MRNYLLHIFFYFAIALLIVNIYAFYIFQTNDGYVMMDDFIVQLENAPTYDVQIDTFVNDLTIKADWGIYNSARNFINLFGRLLSFIAWFGVMLYNMVIYLGYFLYLLGAQTFAVM